MSVGLVSILTFLAILLLIAGAASLASDVFFKNRARVSRRLEEEFRSDKAEVRKSSAFKDLERLAADPLAGDAPPSRTQKIERLLGQAGLAWTPGRFLGLTAVAAAVPGLSLLLVSGWIAAVLGAAGGAVIPYAYVAVKRNRRMEAIRRQLPEAYDLMARALRAGQTVAQSMQGVADEFPEPIAGEFLHCYEQQNLGLPMELALRDLARRTGLMEVNIFVVAVVVQRQVGGNLAEMLEGLALVVRERYRIRGSIRTLTAEGRMQAAVLMALPPGILVAMLVLNREYALVLFEYPWMLGAIAVSMGIGALWIRKIINFDF